MSSSTTTNPDFAYIFSQMINEKSGLLKEEIKNATKQYEDATKRYKAAKDAYLSLCESTPSEDRIRIQFEYKTSIALQLSTRLFYDNYIKMADLVNKEAQKTFIRMDDHLAYFEKKKTDFASNDEYEIYKLHTLSNLMNHFF